MILGRRKTENHNTPGRRRRARRIWAKHHKDTDTACSRRLTSALLPTQHTVRRCTSRHVSGAAWAGKRTHACPTADWTLTGTANESLQRPSASIVVPSRVVPLSVVPLSVAIMRATPVRVVHTWCMPVSTMRSGAVERDTVAQVAPCRVWRAAVGESRVRAGSAPQRERSGAERA